MRDARAVLRDAEAVLRHPTLHIRVVELEGDHSARADFDYTADDLPDAARPIKLTVDTTQIGLIPATLHEILHLLFYQANSGLASDLDEAIIKALTDELFRKRYFTAGRLRRWRKLIDQAIIRSPAS